MDSQAPDQGATHWLVQQPFAHRGLHDSELPENSLAALEAAATLGLGLELDVHLAADDVPVVIHDYNLKRVVGVPDRVADLTSEDLAKVRLLGTDHGVPTLRQALRAAGGAPTLIEIKSPPRNAKPGALEAAVSACLDQDPFADRRALMSFDPDCLGWFARHRPATLRGQVSSDFRMVPIRLPPLRKWGLRHLLYNRTSKPHFIAYDVRALPALMAYLHRLRGLPLLAWTIRSEEALAHARRHADNVIWETLPVERVRAMQEDQELAAATPASALMVGACGMGGDSREKAGPGPVKRRAG